MLFYVFLALLSFIQVAFAATGVTVSLSDSLLGGDDVHGRVSLAPLSPSPFLSLFLPNPLTVALSLPHLTPQVRVYFSTIKSDGADSKGPMYENGDEQDTNQVYGFDAVFSSSSLSAELPESAKGYPLSRFSDLANLEPQSYNVQVGLARFKEVRSDGSEAAAKATYRIPT